MTNPLTSLLTGGGTSIGKTLLNTVLGQPAGNSITAAPSAGGLSSLGLSSAASLPGRVSLAALQGLRPNSGGVLANVANALGAAPGTGLQANPAGMSTLASQVTDQSQGIQQGMQNSLNQNSFNQAKMEQTAGVMKETVSLSSAVASLISHSGDGVKAMYQQG